jgi:hypothetical protein
MPLRLLSEMQIKHLIHARVHNNAPTTRLDEEGAATVEAPDAAGRPPAPGAWARARAWLAHRGHACTMPLRVRAQRTSSGLRMLADFSRLVWEQTRDRLQKAWSAMRSSAREDGVGATALGAFADVRYSRLEAAATKLDTTIPGATAADFAAVNAMVTVAVYEKQLR